MEGVLEVVETLDPGSGHYRPSMLGIAVQSLLPLSLEAIGKASIEKPTSGTRLPR